VSTNWLVSTGSVSSYPVSMLNFIWFADEKCSSRQHLETWRHKIRSLAIQKLIHLESWVCWCTVLLKGVKVKLSPHVKVIVLGIFVATMLKLQQFVISKPDIVIDAGQLFSKSVSTGCNKPVCTRSTLWRQHYVTTSK